MATGGTWPDGVPREGDEVWVPDVDDPNTWVQATFREPGDPEDAVWVEDARAERGGYRRDVGWVVMPDGLVRPYRYHLIRMVKPGADRG